MDSLLKGMVAGSSRGNLRNLVGPVNDQPRCSTTPQDIGERRPDSKTKAAPPANGCDPPRRRSTRLCCRYFCLVQRTKRGNALDSRLRVSAYETDVLGPILFGLRTVAAYARRSRNLASSRVQSAQGNLFLPRHLLSRHEHALCV